MNSKPYLSTPLIKSTIWFRNNMDVESVKRRVQKLLGKEYKIGRELLYQISRRILELCK